MSSRAAAHSIKCDRTACAGGERVGTVVEERHKVERLSGTDDREELFPVFAHAEEFDLTRFGVRALLNLVRERLERLAAQRREQRDRFQFSHRRGRHIASGPRKTRAIRILCHQNGVHRRLLAILQQCDLPVSDFCHSPKVTLVAWCNCRDSPSKTRHSVRPRKTRLLA